MQRSSAQEKKRQHWQEFADYMSQLERGHISYSQAKLFFTRMMREAGPDEMADMLAARLTARKVNR